MGPVNPTIRVSGVIGELWEGEFVLGVEAFEEVLDNASTLEHVDRAAIGTGMDQGRNAAIRVYLQIPVRLLFLNLEVEGVDTVIELFAQVRVGCLEFLERDRDFLAARGHASVRDEHFKRFLGH